MNKNKLIWIPIVFLAFVFLFFGIDKFVHPDVWIGWIPAWMDGLLGISKETFNTIAGVSEIIFALLLLISKTRFWGALGMTLQLLFITLVLTRFSEVGIRDIGLLGMALYLMLYHVPGKKVEMAMQE